MDETSKHGCSQFANAKATEDMKEITILLDEVVNKFRKQIDRNAELSKENDKLINELWKDEEITRLQTENGKLRELLRYGFGISKEEHDKIKDFLDQRRTVNRKIDEFGGNVTYSFTPTGIGVVGEVELTKGGKSEKFTFRGPDNW